MISWIFGKPKTGLPEPTALQVQKSNQIEQLRAFNLSVSELIRDVEYQVAFNAGGLKIYLNISLPPQFPYEKPGIKVSPPVRHPWVNDQHQVIGSPTLNNFTVHSNLGKEVQNIIEEFQKTPPVAMQQPYGMPYSATPPGGIAPTLPPQYPAYSQAGYRPPHVGMPTLPSGGTSVTSASSQPVSYNFSSTSGQPAQASPQSAYQIPDMPTSCSKLKEMSLSELQALENDEDKLLKLILELPEIQKIAETRSELCRINEEQAKENLNHKPILEDKKRILLEKYDQLNDLKQRMEELYAKQNELRQQFDPSNLQVNLKVAAVQAEEEAEHIAEEFLDGKIDVKEFNKQFMEKRKLANLRKVKEEKLGQLMGQSSNYRY